jgi:hypothetical protein
MALSSLLLSLALSLVPGAARRPAPRREARRSPCRPRLEALEDRLAPATWTVTNTSPDSSVSGSLPWAVAKADDDTSGTTATINFAAGSGEVFATPQTIALTDTLNLDNTTAGESIIIAGPAAALTIQGGGSASNFSVFTVAADTTATIDNLTITDGFAAQGGGIANGGTLTVSNCTLSGNSATGFGGGLVNYGSLTLGDSALSDNSSAAGGGLFNYGTLTVSSSTLAGNSAVYGGGGIYNWEGGALTVSNSTLSGNSSYQGGGIFNGYGGALTVTDSALTNNDGSAGGGGGIFNGGALTVSGCAFSGDSGCGIYNTATLTVGESTFSGNTAAAGGGIDNAGTLTVSDSSFSGNSALLGGGGINSAGTLIVSDSTISGNSAHDGGGIGNAGGTLTVSNSTISGNSAAYGGGVSTWGTMMVSNSRFSDNSAAAGGGGITNGYGGALTATGCTLSGNTAGFGGGMWSTGTATVNESTIAGNSSNGIDNEGTLALSNCTVAGNSGSGIFDYGNVTVSDCTVSGNSAPSGGGIAVIGPATVTVQNTIIAGNTAGSAPDVSGPLSSQGYNLVGVSDGSSGWVASDLTGTGVSPLDALLAAQGDNGGPTLTMALLPGSPAIEGGTVALAVDASGNPLTIDQRGAPRIVNGTVDVGAVESGLKRAPAVNVTGGTFTYDGQPHPASASVVGLRGVDLGPPTVTYTDANGNPVAAPTGAGTYTATASFAGDLYYTAATGSAAIVIEKATPVFSLVSPPVVTDGAALATLSGTILAGPLAPTGSVTVTINGVSRTAAINPDGTFAVAFPTAALPTGAYQIQYDYAGDANFEGVTAVATLDVTYGILVLSQKTTAKAGSSIPVQIELLNAAKQDVSSAGTTVTAVEVAPPPGQSGGIVSLNSAFTFNPQKGNTLASYTYSLKTKGLSAGTYLLYFTVSGDPLEHSVSFTLQ